MSVTTDGRGSPTWEFRVLATVQPVVVLAQPSHEVEQLPVFAMPRPMFR